MYKNQINLLPLTPFTPTQINFFFPISNKLKQQHTNTLHFSFHQLKQLTNYTPQTPNINTFLHHLQTLYHKILHITYTITTQTKIKKFLLFYNYQIHISQKYLQIPTSPHL
ncbi:RepB family plasmid replication initiator protein, partial [Staphylococcus epidermidis]|uniref:RepB family plasmid replication initiator protein n=1 Tax=Staphylococcus epidermidis TaxID=1282 RepID=UPI0021B411B2